MLFGRPPTNVIIAISERCFLCRSHSWREQGNTIWIKKSFGKTIFTIASIRDTESFITFCENKKINNYTALGDNFICENTYNEI